jgi:hypothetical protein
MGDLGRIGQGKDIILWLNLKAVPSGDDPTVTITRGAGTALDIPITDQPMTDSGDGLHWYYPYTTEATAQNDIYKARYKYDEANTILYDDDNWRITVNDEDDLATDIAAISPTTGAYAITINIKDDAGTPANIADVKVQVHNSSNDDSPRYGPKITNLNGNIVFNLDDGTYYVRAQKTGYTFTNSTFVVSGTSATVNKTMNALVITPPVDGETCTLWFQAKKLDNTNTTGLTTYAKTQDPYSEVDGVLIEDTKMPFIYHSGTNTYRLDVRQGTVIKFTGTNKLGLVHEDFTVPAVSTYDLTTYFEQ